LPRPTDLVGLLGNAVLIVALSVWAGGRTGQGGARLRLLAAAGALAAIAPLGGLPLAGHLRGVVGDLSLTTLLLLLIGLWRGFRGLGSVSPRETLGLQVLVAAGGLLLYPLTLGLGPFDPYRPGYGNHWMLLVLLAIVLVAWLLELPLIAWCVSLGVLAWSVGWYESRNLWDYLIDPLVAAWGLGALAIRGARWRLRGRGCAVTSRAGLSR
jgi:hypothetical protein